MLEPKQNELLLADRLSLIDKDLAVSISVVMVRNTVACIFPKLRSGISFVLQGRHVIQLTGDQAEKDLADPRGREDRAKLLIYRPLRLDDPLRDHAIARHWPGRRNRVARFPDRQKPTRLLVGGQSVGPENAIAQHGRERARDLSMQVVAALGSVGRCLEIEVALGRQLPDRSNIFVQVFKSRRFRNHDGQVVELLGELLERARIIDERRRNLIGGGLPLVTCLGLVADPEVLDLDP